jgi:4-hydroxy-tetrahydrodipicolinate reductase
MDLVGLYVHSDEKAGRDAGELCGVGPTGVVATQNVDDLIALDADCVLYMQQRIDFDDICRIVESGKNIVTTRGEFHRPASLDPQIRERVEAACHRGGTSIHSTGSSPGFITEALPFVLTSIQRRLDCLTISEFADLSQRDSPDLLFNIMGFGREPTAFDERRLGHGRQSFGPSLELVAETLSMPLDSVEASGEVAVVPRPVEIAAGTLQAGTVGGQRIEVSGIRNGQPVLRFVATWYCAVELEPQWALRDTGWRVEVAGDAPLDVDIRFPVPADEYAAVSPGYTAHRAVNAVPVVCAAEPGIRSTADLPQIIAILS